MKVQKFILATIFTLISGTAQAEGFREPPAEVKAAFQACAAQVGVTVTEGQRPELNETQREQMRSCLDAKGVRPPQGGPHGGGRGGPGRHEDFAKVKQCLADAGITLPEPVEGQRPQLDDAARAAMRACHDKIRQESESNSNSNASSNGVVSSSAL